MNALTETDVLSGQYRASRVGVVLGHADLAGVIDQDCHDRMRTLDRLLACDLEAVILSGGTKSSCDISEAEQMHQLVDSDVGSRMILERFSRTTAENAWCCALLARSLQCDELVVFCTRAQSMRGRVFFARALGEVGCDARLRFVYSPAQDLKSWLYELRWAHHIPRNMRSARDRMRQMQSGIGRRLAL